MNEDSEEFAFKSVSQCSAFELKGERLGSDLTFRSPNTLFDGKNISAYFKEKSEPTKFQNESTSNHSFRVIEPSSELFSKSLVLNDSLLNEISVSDNTIAISEKLVRQQKVKQTQRMCVPESFSPNSNSTEMSIIPVDSFDFSIIRQTTLKLRVPIFSEHKVQLSIDNKFRNRFNLYFRSSSFGENAEVKQMKECFISPFHNGLLDTGIVIIPLKIGIFAASLEVYLVADSEYKCESRKSFVKLSCVLQSSNIQIVSDECLNPHYFLNTLIRQEKKLMLDFKLSSPQFDIAVPLEFRLFDKHISFIPNSELSEDELLVQYRCPSQNTLKTSMDSCSQLKIPVRIRPKSSVNRYEIAVFLDTEKRNYIKSFFLNVQARH